MNTFDQDDLYDNKTGVSAEMREEFLAHKVVCSMCCIGGEERGDLPDGFKTEEGQISAKGESECLP